MSRPSLHLRIASTLNPHFDEVPCWRIDLVEIKQGLVNKIPNATSRNKGILHYYLPIYFDSLDDKDYYSLTSDAALDWQHKLLSTIYEIVQLIHDNTSMDEEITLIPSYYKQSAYLVSYAYMLFYYNGNEILALQELYSLLHLPVEFEMRWPSAIKNVIIPKLIEYYSYVPINDSSSTINDDATNDL